ncbi:MAG TPA: alpha/beta hydrolase-fold protein [Chitinophagaceae bacterium]|nr:alpha/beta hydrolase-fold protein [Chitinophagaceae bacterium]
MRHLLTTLSIFCWLVSSAQLPFVVSGTLKRYDSFPSKYITARNVDVWVPDNYSAAKKYNVLYMHDGQMLFDSTTTWNKITWDADDAVTALLKENKIRDVIIVGIWNGGKTRHSDYFPQKPFEALSQAEKETVYAAARSNGVSVFNSYKIQSDNYLKFLVKELKPFIYKNYSVYKDRSHTFVAGSSMGGLISLYAICEYPKVFGGAACLSTHWPGIFTMENNPVPNAFFNYMRKHLPKPQSHKIYFDYGDATLDALYPPLQQKADEVMKEKGFSTVNWITKYFPGEDHSERAWKRRLSVPLTFLLGK